MQTGWTAYVIFGSRGGFVSPFNLANLNGTNGFMVPGIASGGQLGISVSTAEDINGDNIADLVLGVLMNRVTVRLMSFLDKIHCQRLSPHPLRPIILLPLQAVW